MLAAKCAHAAVLAFLFKCLSKINKYMDFGTIIDATIRYTPRSATNPKAKYKA